MMMNRIHPRRKYVKRVEYLLIVMTVLGCFYMLRSPAQKANQPHPIVQTLRELPTVVAGLAMNRSLLPDPKADQPGDKSPAATVHELPVADSVKMGDEAPAEPVQTEGGLNPNPADDSQL